MKSILSFIALAWATLFKKKTSNMRRGAGYFAQSQPH